MSFLIAVVTSNLRAVLITKMSSSSRVGQVNSSCWGGFSAYMLNISTTLLLLLLLFGLLIGSFAVFEAQEMQALQILIRRFFGLLIPRFPSSKALRLGRHSMNRAITLRTMLVYVLDIRGGLEAGFCLRINCFFYQFCLIIVFPPASLHLGLNRMLEAFSKYANENCLFWSLMSVKLKEDGLEMLKVGNPILNFFLLILRILPNPIPDTIDE